MATKQEFAKAATLGVVGTKHHGLDLSDVIFEHPKTLKPNPNNTELFSEEDETYFNRLRDDVRERGIVVPLLVKPDKTLLAGHNRLRVALEIGLERVPVQYVEDALSAEQEVEFLIKDNLLRRQLSPAQSIALYKKLFPNFEERIKTKVVGRKPANGERSELPEEEKPLTAKEIAARTGQKERTVQHQLQQHRKREEAVQISQDGGDDVELKEFDLTFKNGKVQENGKVYTSAKKKEQARTESDINKRFNLAREEVLSVIKHEEFTLWHSANTLGRELVKKAAGYFASQNDSHESYNTFCVMEDVRFGFARIHTAFETVAAEELTSDEREMVYAFVQSKINDLQQRLNMMQEEV